MNMTRKLLIMLLCCFSSFISVKADSDKGDNKPAPETKTVVIKPIKTPSTRPNTPSHVYIECTYTEGYMEFVLPEGIESVQVTLTEGDFELIDFATIENPVIILPSLSGVYDLVCTTPDGREFGAEIYF